MNINFLVISLFIITKSLHSSLLKFISYDFFYSSVWFNHIRKPFEPAVHTSLFRRLWWYWWSGSSPCWWCTWASCCAWIHYWTSAGHSHPTKNTPTNMTRLPLWGVPRECLNVCMCELMCWVEWVTSRTSGSVRCRSSATTYMINTRCWTECSGLSCSSLVWMSSPVLHAGFFFCLWCTFFVWSCHATDIICWHGSTRFITIALYYLR